MMRHKTELVSASDDGRLVKLKSPSKTARS